MGKRKAKKKEKNLGQNTWKNTVQAFKAAICEKS